MPFRPSGLEKCGQQMKFVRQAIADSDADSLKGLLLSEGVNLKSVDQSVPAEVLNQASNAWNAGAGSHWVRIADGRHTCNLSVQLVDQISEEPGQQGLIEVNRDDEGNMSASVLIKRTCDDRPLSNLEIGAVLTHEIGHFLGLDDVTGNDFIMGEFDRSHLVLKPNPEEVAAIQELRKVISIRLAN